MQHVDDVHALEFQRKIIIKSLLCDPANPFFNNCYKSITARLSGQVDKQVVLFFVSILAAAFSILEKKNSFRLIDNCTGLATSGSFCFCARPHFGLATSFCILATLLWDPPDDFRPRDPHHQLYLLLPSLRH